MKKMLVCLTAGLLPISQTGAQPAEWEAAIEGPRFDTEVTDVAASVTQLDNNNRPDLIVAAASRDAAGAVRFTYRIGFNLDQMGKPAQWTEPLAGPALGTRPSGVGMAILQIDSEAAPDLVLITRDPATATADRLVYRIGWNLRADGTPVSWSDPQTVSDVGRGGRGAAIATAQLDANARPDIVVGTYEPVADAPDRLRYRIGFNLNTSGAAANWSTWRSLAGTGDSINGITLILAELEGGPRPDLLFLARSDAAQVGEFRYRVAENLDAQAVPVSWSPRYRFSGAGLTAKGAAGAFVDLDEATQGARQDLIVGSYDPTAAGNSGAFVYRVGRNWDGAPPRVRLNHRPLHPALDGTVTYTASAEDPNGLTSIQIIVNGNIVATCMTSPCVYSGIPVRDPQRGTVTYEAAATDSGGRPQSSGRREHQMGPVIPNVFPAAAVPIWVTGPIGQRIDIVFLRDRDTYGGTTGFTNFMREIGNVLDRTYAADEAVGRNLGRFNFWYLTATATAGPGCVRTVPDEYWKFGNAGAIVHADRFRDCAWSGVFSSEPFEIDTFMHETGHAAFGLSDLLIVRRALRSRKCFRTSTGHGHRAKPMLDCTDGRLRRAPASRTRMDRSGIASTAIRP